MNKIYGVVFKDNGKVYNFSGSNEYNIGDYVIVETEKGYQYGKIVTSEEKTNNDKILKEIVRLATEKDHDINLENLAAALRASKNATEIIAEMGLDMKIVGASYTFDKKQLLFNFVANERVDFRELVKKLANIYKTRIELRQIGVRDKAKEIGGFGPCGRKLCCSSFNNMDDSITMNMAKNQNIALNPNIINGSCGRLLCCLAYEDNLYTENRRDLPNVGESVNIKQGRGIVQSIDILNKTYIVSVNNEKYKIEVD